MDFKSLLILPALAASMSAAAFEWEPTVTQPYPSLDVTQSWQVERLVVCSYQVTGLSISGVMPQWIDEDGNVIEAAAGVQNPNGWNPDEFAYTFDFNSFKGNGEYILNLPEGMLLNAAGEKSDRVQIPYTFDIPELAGSAFDDFAVLSVSPDLTAAQGIWDEQKIVINTNHNDAIGLTMLTVTDETENESVLISSNFTTGRVPGNTDPIAWTIGGAFKFYEGHQYKADLVFYNGKDQRTPDGEPTPIVARASYGFTGKVEAYKYSPAELLSVVPAPGVMTIATPDEAVFTYTFSQPVEVYKADTPLGPMGSNVYNSACLSSNDDKTVWTLNLSDDSFMLEQDASIVINIYARDLDGYQLRGNAGSEGNSCFQYAWNCELGAVKLELVTPTEGETLDELKKVTVKSANGQAMSWSMTSRAYVLNLQRDIIGTLDYDTSEVASAEVTFTNWRTENGLEPISLVKEGSYVVIFDHGCFIFGEQFDARLSHSLVSNFKISGSKEQPGPDPKDQETFNYVSSSLENGSTQSKVEEFYLVYPEEVGLMEYYADVVDCSINDGTPGVIGRAGLDLDWDDFNRINVKFEQPLDKTGDYQIVFKARTIGTPEFCESMGASGICNPEFAISFKVETEIEEPQLEIVSPAEGATLDELKEIIVKSDGEQEMKWSGTGSAYVLNIEREVVGTLSYDSSNASATEVTFTQWATANGLEPISLVKEGAYVVIFEQGCFTFGSDSNETESQLVISNFKISGALDQPGPDPKDQETFNYVSSSLENGSTQNKVEAFYLVYPDEVGLMEYTADVVDCSINDGTPGVIGHATLDLDWEDWYRVNVVLDKPLDTKGDYMIVFKARTIGTLDFCDSMGASGICNPEFAISFKVDPVGTAVEAVAAEAGAEVYDLHGRRVGSDLTALPKGIYVAGGKKITVK